MLLRHLALLAALGAVACSATRLRFAFDPEREEGVHGEVDVEWWYHFGWLNDVEGGRWAWFSSFFRYQPKEGPLVRYLIYDLVDLSTGQRTYVSRVGAEALPGIAAVTGNPRPPEPHGVIPGTPLERPGDPLRLTYGEDRLERTGRGTYRLKVGPVQLELRAEAPTVPVEGTGLTGLHQPDDMHYYTIPRLAAAGTVHGRRATGTFWYDHQWGASWIGPTIGWSWWGLQFDDGTSANAYILRDVATGSIHRSVLTRDDGRVEKLVACPIEEWTAPSGTRYPVSWELSAGPYRLKVEPFFRERECPILGGTTIWEGPVRVSGSHAGRGFQELVGYSRR